MVNIRINSRPRSSESVEVGEIDTRAPFQSVRAAVSLFREVADSKDKSAPSIKKTKSSLEGHVLDDEAQLLFAQRELNKFKQKLNTDETTKAKAISELEKAKRTEQELLAKLKTVTLSKQSAVEAAEAVKSRIQELELAKSQNTIGIESWKKELESARNEHSDAVTELDSAKQQLNKIRQDFDATLEAKSAAFQQAAEAQRLVKVNSEKASEISREISALRDSIEALKLASSQIEQDQSKIMEEKEAKFQSYTTSKEEAEKKLMSLKNEFDPEGSTNLEAKLIETTKEIEIVQEEMRKAHSSEMNSIRSITSELKKEIQNLEEVHKEENSLQNLIDSLRLELENTKNEKSSLKEKEIAAESLLSSLKAELNSLKAELEQKDLEASFNEQKAKLQDLLSEIEHAKRESEAIREDLDKLKEAEASRIITEEAEKKLVVILEEVEEAKAAETKAQEEMKILSENHRADPDAGWGSRIELTVKEFEALSRKVGECADMAEEEEEKARVEIAQLNAAKNEIDMKLEASLKAIEEIKLATDIALKNAESAESAKMVVEGELSKWRREEKKVAAAEASSGHIYL